MNDESTTARMVWGYLALITFGIFGVHRFMLGRPYTGVLYAFTGGLLGIGLIFDFFIGVNILICSLNNSIKDRYFPNLMLEKMQIIQMELFLP